MKDNNSFSTLPVPVQKRVMLSAALAGGIFIMSLLLSLLTPDKVLLVPGAILMCYTASDAIFVYRRARKNKYLVLEGVCLNVVHTRFKKRVKSVLLDTGGYRVRVYPKNNLCKPEEGERIVVYVYHNAPVYEQEGEYLLRDYLLLQKVH